MNKPESLLSRDYLLICASQFCGSMANYSIMQILPLFLLDVLNCNKSVLGIILALSPLAALLCRPINGHAVDIFPRKALFLAVSVPLTIFFPLHLVIKAAILFGLLRIVQGVLFSFMTLSINTIAIDTIPRKSLGTGLGIFSSMLSIGMIFGPMIGLYVFDLLSYPGAFWFSCLLSALGTLVVIPVRTRKVEHAQKKKFSLLSMFYKEGLPTAVVLFFGIFMYGMCLNYLSVFAREHGLSNMTGTFFLVMGTGLLFSRMFSGFLTDRGFMIPLNALALVMLGVTGIVFANTTTPLVFLLDAFCVGIATGIVQPSMQTLLVQFGGPERVASSNSLFFVAMDGGLVLCVLCGGFIADLLGLENTFFVGGALQFVGLAVFLLKVAPQYRKIERV
ncbi:MAG: MFS transporter [Mailhella sp.]|nr:MFS transporter [Mailhella sp.]